MALNTGFNADRGNIKDKTPCPRIGQGGQRGIKVLDDGGQRDKNAGMADYRDEGTEGAGAKDPPFEIGVIF